MTSAPTSIPGANENMEVLLVTPTGRDAQLISEALTAVGIESISLPNAAAAAKVIGSRDCGALLAAEEALDQSAIEVLGSALKSQPTWSTLPILVLTPPGEDFLESRFRERRRSPLGTTILLERPIKAVTLVSAVKSALDARTRQYERRLTIAALRQSEKLAAVGRLASSIAHEINNPLEAVTNLLFILDSTPLDDEQRGYLATARRELARVSEISSQTLTFNRQRDIRGEASVVSLMDSVLVLYQGRLAGSNIQIERRYRNTAPIVCYPGELRQVFANLIGNAFDASRGGGRILLRERPASHSRTGQPGVRVTIADTGQGMNASMKSHLFEPFRSTKGNSGNGLGLWISKGIVDKHRGSIRMRSSQAPGKSGTVFSIFIPFERRSESGCTSGDGELRSNCA